MSFKLFPQRTMQFRLKAKINLVKRRVRAGTSLFTFVPLYSKFSTALQPRDETHGSPNSLENTQSRRSSVLFEQIITGVLVHRELDTDSTGATELVSLAISGSLGCFCDFAAVELQGIIRRRASILPVCAFYLSSDVAVNRSAVCFLESLFLCLLSCHEITLGLDSQP
jgi:hypothetical protein